MDLQAQEGEGMADWEMQAEERTVLWAPWEEEGTVVLGALERLATAVPEVMVVVGRPSCVSVGMMLCS